MVPPNLKTSRTDTTLLPFCGWTLLFDTAPCVTAQSSPAMRCLLHMPYEHLLALEWFLWATQWDLWQQDDHATLGSAYQNSCMSKTMSAVTCYDLISIQRCQYFCMVSAFACRPQVCCVQLSTYSALKWM